MAERVSQADREQLERLETELWRADTRFDRSRMEELFAPDFAEFGRSGRIYSRGETLAVKTQEIPARLPLENFQVRLLSADVALVTYDSDVAYASGRERGHRSSIWTRSKSAEGWTLRFHQGTAISDAD